MEHYGSECLYAKCKYIGDIPIECHDSYVISVLCFYDPHTLETIILPQVILDEVTIFNKWIRSATPGTTRSIGNIATSKWVLLLPFIKYNIYRMIHGEDEWYSDKNQKATGPTASSW